MAFPLTSWMIPGCDPLICVYRMSSKVVSLSRLDLMFKTHFTTKRFMQDW